MPSSSQSSNDDASIAAAVAGAILLVAGVGYIIALFISGSVGIVKQFANPAEHHYFNATILIWTALPLTALAYLVTPEFGCRYGARVPVAFGSAAAGTVAFIIAALFLAPSIERPSALEFLAGGLDLFTAFGIMPTFAVARIVTSFNADIVVARQGDHVIATDKLTPETARIIEKHCGKEMRRPSGWQPFTLWGDAGRITHADLQKILALEEAEEKQLAELYRQRTPNEERRTVEGAFKELATHKANTAREIAALRSEAERLRQAAAAASVRDRAALLAAREEKRQALQELLLARVDLEDAHTTAKRLELALNDKAAAVRRATAAVEETKVAALREISRNKQEDRDARALLVTDIENLLSIVAHLEHERAAAAAKREALNREVARVAEAAAAEYAAMALTQATQQREITRLKAKLAEQADVDRERLAKRAAPTKPPAAVAPAPTPKNTHLTPRLTLVVDNPCAERALFNKSPERHGVPQRLWRRTHRTLRKGACE